MLRYLVYRLLLAVPTVLLVAICVFTLIRLVPGDPALLILGDRATPETLLDMRQRLGLDQPLPLQFLAWTGHALGGDLGRSIATDRPVLPLVLGRFLVSAQIVLPAVLIAAVIAVPLGMLAAWRQNRLPDIAIVAASTALLSIPTFWMGLLLLLVFALKLHWLPIVGYVSPSEDLLQGSIYILMPVATLVLHELGGLLRMMRASSLEILRLDYITHARAKGLAESAVLWRHAFPNAFGPTLTLLGLVLGNLLGGIAVVETVFTVPGLGRLLVDAIFARDYPVIQGCLLLVALVYVLVNLMVDLVYPLFDPRVVAA